MTRIDWPSSSPETTDQVDTSSRPAREVDGALEFALGWRQLVVVVGVIKFNEVQWEERDTLGRLSRLGRPSLLVRLIRIHLDERTAHVPRRWRRRRRRRQRPLDEPLMIPIDLPELVNAPAWRTTNKTTNRTTTTTTNERRWIATCKHSTDRQPSLLYANQASPLEPAYQPGERKQQGDVPNV